MRRGYLRYRLVLFFSSAEAFLWLQSGHDTGVNEAACSAGYTLGAAVLGVYVFVFGGQRRPVLVA